MTLYELYTGGIGEAYERCYIWAQDEQEACRLALPVCREKYSGVTEDGLRQMRLTALFTSNAPPFCTALSDRGFGVGEGFQPAVSE